MTGSLDHVKRGTDQRTTTKGENDRVGVQRSQPAVGQPGYVEVQLWQPQLRGDNDADQHANDTPDNGHNDKLPYYFIGVSHKSFHLLLNQ